MMRQLTLTLLKELVDAQFLDVEIDDWFGHVACLKCRTEMCPKPVFPLYVHGAFVDEAVVEDIGYKVAVGKGIVDGVIVVALFFCLFYMRMVSQSLMK